MNRYITFVAIMLNLATIVLPCFGEQRNEKEPHAEDYPVTERYNGRPAKVDFSSGPEAKRFKTRLTDGIKKGVNFAGQFTIVSWGCGTSCAQSAILETKTGKVCGWFNSCGGESFTPNSRLLIINPGAGDSSLYPEGCHTEYYFWNGTSLERIKEIR